MMNALFNLVCLLLAAPYRRPVSILASRSVTPARVVTPVAQIAAAPRPEIVRARRVARA